MKKLLVAGAGHSGSSTSVRAYVDNGADVPFVMLIQRGGDRTAVLVTTLRAAGEGVR